MNRIRFCLILILASFQVQSAEFNIRWLQEPLARLAVTAYFMQPSSKTDTEKFKGVLSHIHKSMISENRIHVVSLQDYLAHRYHMPETMSEYWQNIHRFGLINPLNILTPNSSVFEQIVEYEVRETQKWIRELSPELSRFPELRAAVMSAQSLLSTYEMGLNFRDGVDRMTRPWEGVPVLGLLRSIGQNIVNPIVRSTIYSEPVLNRMRTELQKQMRGVQSQSQTYQDRFRQRVLEVGESILERQMALNLFDLEFVKPLKSLDSKTLLNLALNFFHSLPDELKQDMAWTWLIHNKNRSYSVSSIDVIDFFQRSYPRLAEVTNHFISWISRDEIKSEIQRLSPLPIWESSYSLSRIVHEDLGRKNSEEPERLLGEFTQKSLWGIQKSRFHIFSQGSASERSDWLSLDEFIKKYPEYGDFLKRKIAQSVLHNAFSFGLRSLFNSEVRIYSLAGRREFRVEILSLDHREVHPTEQTEKLISAVAKLPLKELMKIGSDAEGVVNSMQNLSTSSYRDVGQFLAEPENFRWALHIFQLSKIVGIEIVQSEIKSYLLKHPHVVLSFIKKKWLERSKRSFFNGQAPNCQLFYNR